MEGIQPKKSGIEEAIEHIKEHGLPSVEQMRSEIARHEEEDQRLREELHIKLEAYKILFKKYKEGKATPDEQSALVTLSDEFEALRKNLKIE